MSSQALARRSLQLDAVYCGLVGAAAVLYAEPAAEQLGVPPVIVRAAGTGTLAWAATVAGFAGADEWRRVTALVALANIGTAKGLGIWGLMRADGRGRRLLGCLAIQVGTFGAVQVAALVTDRRAS